MINITANLTSDELNLFIILLANVSIGDIFNLDKIEHPETIEKNLEEIKEKFFIDIASKS
jgi:hypothetical protein